MQFEIIFTMVFSGYDCFICLNNLICRFEGEIVLYFLINQIYAGFADLIAFKVHCYKSDLLIKRIILHSNLPICFIFCILLIFIYNS